MSRSVSIITVREEKNKIDGADKMNLDFDIAYPETAVFRQTLFAAPLTDIGRAVFSAVEAKKIERKIRPGQTVAVAVGSRGINRIDRIVSDCIEYLKQIGLHPYIVPAMGSHGGGNEQGQKQVLENIGISESTTTVPIHAAMDVVPMGTLPSGVEVFFSQEALKADFIVPINRIKRHTKFRAPVESGLCKMLTIGLGKKEGAAEFHRRAIEHGFQTIEEGARMVLTKTPVLFGLAILEDGYGRPAKIEALLPEEMIEQEKKLLKEAISMAGSIPFDQLDLLIVDMIGKDISGIGMDSNVTGRHRDITGDFHLSPHVKRIFVRDLSPGSEGNGNGIGLADITTTRLIEALDLEKTYVNALTAVSPEKAALPMYVDTDRRAFNACAVMIGKRSMTDSRIVRIQDTKHLEHIQISKTLEPEANADPRLKRVSLWKAFEFDSYRNLLPLSAVNRRD